MEGVNIACWRMISNEIKRSKIGLSYTDLKETRDFSDGEKRAEKLRFITSGYQKPVFRFLDFRRWWICCLSQTNID